MIGSISPRNSNKLSSRTSKPSRSFGSIAPELKYSIFRLLPNQTLSKLRILNKSLKIIIDDILETRYKLKHDELKEKLSGHKLNYNSLLATFAPQLQHYSQFLQNISTNEITEATWYSTPPNELETVCKCLVILKNGALDTTWQSVKRQMVQYNFKYWIQNLKTTVEEINFENVLIVERIIQLDSNITYERLREVSTAGYKLLIVVAACLQHCTINRDVLAEKVIIKDLIKDIDQCETYLSYLKFKDHVIKKESIDVPMLLRGKQMRLRC